MKKVEGGFVNSVFKTNGTITKIFEGEDLVDKSVEERLKREALALRRFGGVVAPALLRIGSDSIVQAFLSGVNAETLEQKPFYEAGRLLRQVHVPIRRNPEYLRQHIEQRFNKAREKTIEMFDLTNVNMDVDWNEVFRFGTTRVHRDFWLGNIIVNDKDLRLIDWEFSGIGSPYEDFAIAELWIFREYGGREEFYAGYGRRPDQKTVEQFLKMKCIEFLATYKGKDPIGFYRNKLEVLYSL
jgi:aminoglycoside phosphotransferase (APT) family kinase protein